MRRVVVTGIGALTPIGNTVSEYLHNLRAGTSGANLITYFDASEFKTRFVCEIKDFDSSLYLDRRESRRLDPYTIYALSVAQQALDSAGIDLEKTDLTRFGTIFASGIGGLQSIEHDIAEDATSESDTPRYNPFLIPKMIANMGAGHISIKHGLRGPSFSTVSACASAGHALECSYDNIRLGKADLMITGGSEAPVTRVGVGGFNAMKAMSTRNDDFKTASRPYDLDRDGFVLGEGAGALLLEELEHAKARGATILAEVVGSASSSDAYHIAAPLPDGSSVQRVMLTALEMGGLQPSDVDYINTHGTSTPLGDIAELNAIKAAFGEHVYNVNISSTKSMTGHLLGAAGAIEAIACILAINHNFVPPTINHFTDDPEIDPKLNLTFNKAQDRTVNVVLNNTFGFGGHNSATVFKKFED